MPIASASIKGVNILIDTLKMTLQAELAGMSIVSRVSIPSLTLLTLCHEYRGKILYHLLTWQEDPVPVVDDQPRMGMKFITIWPWQ